MSEAIRFLHALAQAISTLMLYSPGHPATRRSIDGAWQALLTLLAVDAHPLFFFIGTAPVYSGRALHEMRDWPYARRLTEAGVQRLEFDENVTPASLEEFFARLMVRLTTGEIPFEESQEPIPGVAFGKVAIEEYEEAQDAEDAVDPAYQVQVNVDLSDEIEAMGYVLAEGARGKVARAEVEAIARIIGGLLGEGAPPQVRYTEDLSRYPLVHPINTALLVMAAARSAGVDPLGRQRLGVAALFHDIGMTRLRPGIGSQAALGAEERALLETHTSEGARLLIDCGGRGLELAAVVAYEHQLRPDGSGYPHRRVRAVPHWASRLIGVATAYAALRAPRPYRPPWVEGRALQVLEDGAGTVFDAESARLIVATVRPA